MTTIVFWILAIDAAALAVVWAMCRSAPHGYEDRDGFHLGMPSHDHSIEHDRLDFGPRGKTFFSRMADKKFAKMRA